MSIDVGKMADELLKLKELLDKGVISEEEFEDQKKKLLSQSTHSNDAAEEAEPSSMMAEVSIQNSDSASAKEGKRLSLTKTHKILIAIAIVIALFFGHLVVNGPILTGDDKIAYELVMNVAKGFKSPSSVRVVSGTVLNKKDSSDGENCMWCGISAINSFGARTTSYYYIGEDGTVAESDYDGARRQDINVDKINKKLEKKLKGKY